MSCLPRRDFLRLSAAAATAVAGLTPGRLTAAAPALRELFGPADGFGFATLQPHGVEISVRENLLHVTAPAGDLQGERRRVDFPLRPAGANLASFRHLEVEIANRGTTPATFTLWALSGPGWGGVSTFSTSRQAGGRETLAPGARAAFRVDLHARYSGPAVRSTAIDPAAVHRLELVLEPARGPLVLALGPIQATGRGPDPAPGVAARVPVPSVVHAAPAPGRRVVQQLPGWERTEVTHVLALPREWEPGRRFPVIVEYTGNVFYHKFCHSTGRTDQGHLAWGLARGEGFICLNLPFISEDGRLEQVDGWGDIEQTIVYCHAALAFVAQRYGADPRAVFFTGFSRGSYAANYLALRDDRIASVWAGFLTLRNPGAPWRENKVRGWRGVDAGWNERARRMNGRPWFHQPAELGAEVHVDVEFLEDHPSTVATRRWLRKVVAQRLGAPPAGTEP